MTKVANNPVVEALRHKKKLESLRQELLSEIPDAGRLGSMKMAVGDASSRLESLIRNNGGSEATIKPSRREEMVHLKSDFEQKQQISVAAHKLDRRLRGDLEALNEELAALLLPTGIDALLSVVGEITAVKDEITSLNTALEKQKGLANSAGGADDLAAKRDELLADAALGKDVKKALADVQTRLVAAEGLAAKGIDAEQAALVLTGRLATARTRLVELTEAHKLAFAGLLSDRAAQIKDQYQTLATALIESMTSLFAIDALLDRYAPSDFAARFVTGDLRSLKLPLMTCTGELFFGHNIDSYSAAEDEMKRLNELTGGGILPLPAL